MASISVNATAATDAARARCPRTVPANVQTSRPTAEKNEIPLVTRCVNSIMVSTRGAAVISAANSRVTVRVIPPLEDLMIVNHVLRLLAA